MNYLINIAVKLFSSCGLSWEHCSHPEYSFCKHQKASLLASQPMNRIIKNSLKLVYVSLHFPSRPEFRNQDPCRIMESPKTSIKNFHSQSYSKICVSSTKVIYRADQNLAWKDVHFRKDAELRYKVFHWFACFSEFTHVWSTNSIIKLRHKSIAGLEDCAYFLLEWGSTKFDVFNWIWDL